MDRPFPSSRGDRPRRLGLRVHALTLVAGYIPRSILVFLSVTYVAHQIGPRDFGWLNLASALMSYFGLAGLVGIPTWAAGPSTGRPDARNRRTSSAWASPRR